MTLGDHQHPLSDEVLSDFLELIIERPMGEEEQILEEGQRLAAEM